MRALAPSGPSVAKTRWLAQCRSLLAVNDLVGTVVTALADTGRLSNTMIVFTSDNGFLNGEHNATGKKVPYEESIRVPMIVRYDPITAGLPRTDPRLVANIDLAPTFAATAGVVPPLAEDGASMLPLLDGGPTPWRADFLVEGYDDPAAPHGGMYVPTYCALRTERYVFVRYVTGEQELYDVQADPYELTNLLYGVPDAITEALGAQLLSRLEQLCTPAPPGYAF